MGGEQGRQRGARAVGGSALAPSLVQDSSAQVEVRSLLRTAATPAVDGGDLQGMGEGAEGVRGARTGSRFCRLLVEGHRGSVC